MKSILRELVLRLPWLRKPSLRYCARHRLLPALICASPCADVRELLFLPKALHGTQLNQDLFALLINRFRPGYFIEIGANDGFTLSNTIYLEEQFGWRGLLIEANPKYADSLARRTNATVVNMAIAAATGEAYFVDAGLHGGLSEGLDPRHSEHTEQAPRITVPCTTLGNILAEFSPPDIIDFLSIDVEGGEVPIVRQMVDCARRFRCGCIEVNDRRGDINEITGLLNAAGYEVAWAGQTGHDLYFVDPRLCAQPR